MDIKFISHQIISGLVVGLSSIVYTVTHGALLFSGAPKEYLATGITAALVTGFICAFGSYFLKEKTFCIATETSTVSIIASSALVFDFASMTGQVTQATILAIFLLLAMTTGIVFYLVARLNLTNYVRFIPFSVMAGLLASTGWLIFSGGLSMTNNLSLSIFGLESFIKDPVRPELVLALLIGFGLTVLTKKFSATILLPFALIVPTMLVFFFLKSDLCSNQLDICSESLWVFSSSTSSHVIPVWNFDFSSVNVDLLISKFPSVVLVSFVALFSLLLNISSLELTYKKEFDFNQILRVHAGTSLVSGLAGGFFGFLSVSRTTLNKSVAGGSVSAAIVAAMFLYMLLSERELLTLVPRAAMGGIIIFLGISLIKTWLWDQRKLLSKTELAEILLILITVANFGFMSGFLVGIALACISFVIACSKSPLTSLRTNSSLFSSSVVRHEKNRKVLNEWGHHSLILKLTGYIFFGSARNIEETFDKFDMQTTENILIDFSDVIGIDRSAIGVFQRLLRRDSLSNLHFRFVYSAKNIKAIKSMTSDTSISTKVHYYSNLDLAAEAIEESIIKGHMPSDVTLSPFDFIKDVTEKNIFIDHCQLRVFQATEIICNEGDYSSQLFFLKKGSLEIIKTIAGNETRLAKVSDGALVGEMAFYTGEIRSASIKAFSESEVYVLDSNSITGLRKNYPQVASQLDLFVIKKIAATLERMNKLIASSN